MPSIPSVTDTQLRKAKASDKAYRIGCGNRLFLYVSTLGVKHWQLRYRRADGTETVHQFGQYPEVSLARAREMLIEFNAQLNEGVDPVYQKRLEVSAARQRQSKQLLAYASVRRRGLPAASTGQSNSTSALRGTSSSKKISSRQSNADLDSVRPAWSVGSFGHCAEQFIQNKSHEWKNAKHAAQWNSTLALYAYPHIGHLPAQTINLEHVLRILEPIWTTKMETANRLRGRIENVLDYAAARGLRQGDNPARWKGSLQSILPNPQKAKRVQSHAAMPYVQLPLFMQMLQEKGTIGSLALQLLILTATRSGEIRRATWGEVLSKNDARKPPQVPDFSLWIIPVERMKAGREHQIPMSPPARQLLIDHWNDAVQFHGLTRADYAEQVKAMSGSLIFTSMNGKALSDMTLTQLMRREGLDYTAHGFRSTFRDWCAEKTNFPREVCEHALAHQLPDKVEAAYLRTNYLEKRRTLMDEWGRFATDSSKIS